MRRQGCDCPPSEDEALVHCRKEHAAGVDSHHGSRRQIRDGNQGLADQLFRLIVSMNTGEDHAVCACSVIQDKLQELLGLRNGRAFFHLYRPEIGLAEGVKVHLLLKERLNLHIGEVNAVVRREESALVTGSRVRILPVRVSFGGFSSLCFRRRSGRSSPPESRESISENFLMICFHLLSQVSSRCRLKSPVYHHGLSFTSCHVPVVKLLYIESIVTGCRTSQFHLLLESITASTGKSSGGIVQVRRSAKDIFTFRIMPCDDLLSFISDNKRPDGKCRILSCQNS